MLHIQIRDTGGPPPAHPPAAHSDVPVHARPNQPRMHLHKQIPHGSADGCGQTLQHPEVEAAPAAAVPSEAHALPKHPAALTAVGMQGQACHSNGMISNDEPLQPGPFILTSHSPTMQQPAASHSHEHTGFALCWNAPSGARPQSPHTAHNAASSVVAELHENSAVAAGSAPGQADKGRYSSRPSSQPWMNLMTQQPATPGSERHEQGPGASAGRSLWPQARATSVTATISGVRPANAVSSRIQVHAGIPSSAKNRTLSKNEGTPKHAHDKLRGGASRPQLDECDQRPATAKSYRYGNRVRLHGMVRVHDMLFSCRQAKPSWDEFWTFDSW